MKRRFRILPEAAAELAAAAEWYESRRSGLGVELIATIDAALEAILATPLACAAWRQNYRRYTVRHFPYVVFFTLAEDDIEVVAFAHSKRKPGYWLHRARPTMR